MTVVDGMAGSAMFEWCPELDRLYSDRTIIGRSGKEFDNKGALSTPNNIRFLRSVMLDLGPERTLEVGLAFGGSALAIASCHRELGHSQPSVHTAIDLAQSSYWDNVAQDALERAGLSDLVRVIEQPSATALATLYARGERYDLIYIDGSHQFEDVFVDFYFVGRMINTGGVVLFDDSTDPHIAKVLRFIRRNYKSAFEEIDLAKYLSADIGKIRRRVGRLMGRLQLTSFRKLRDASASLRLRPF